MSDRIALSDIDNLILRYQKVMSYVSQRSRSGNILKCKNFHRQCRRCCNAKLKQLCVFTTFIILVGNIYSLYVHGTVISNNICRVNAPVLRKLCGLKVL